MECEICGQDRYLRPIEREGARLYLCSDCGGFPRPNFTKGEAFRPRPYGNRPNYSNNNSTYAKPAFDRPKFDPNSVKDLVEDYGKRISMARQKINMKTDDLARELCISGGYLNKIENGKFKPDNMTARKLEKRLDIVLFEKPADEGKDKKEEEVKPAVVAEEKKE